MGNNGVPEERVFRELTKPVDVFRCGVIAALDSTEALLLARGYEPGGILDAMDTVRDRLKISDDIVIDIDVEDVTQVSAR